MSGDLPRLMLDLLQRIDSFLDRGGPVMWLLATASLLLWTLVSEQLWVQWRRYRALTRRYAELALPTDQRRRQLLTRMLLSQAGRQLRRRLPLIKTLVAVCPMLGLLGTVLGMTAVFEVLAIQGLGQPQALSAGISQATLTTLAGLVIALPGLYFVQLIDHRAERLAERLARQLSSRSAPSAQARA